MALSTNLLKKLPPELVYGLQGGALELAGAGAAAATHAPGRAFTSLATGCGPLDRALPDAGLLKGAVVELTVLGAAALATSIGLLACRSAQQASQELGGIMPWCAFIDPSRSLYAPGVAELGVELEQLLVVRPAVEALSRVALRLVESQCFAVVVIDTVGVPGAELNVSLGHWPRVVRRLAMAVESSQCSVLLITDRAQRRPLPLPVAQRIELQRSQAHKLILQVAKDRRGRISKPRPIVLQEEDASPARSVRGQGEQGPLTSSCQQRVSDAC